MIVVDHTPRKIEAAKEILKHPEYSEYMVLDMKIAMREGKKFEHANEILSTLNFSLILNKLVKDLGSSIELKTNILLQAVDHVMKEKPFNEIQLKDWFGFWQEFEDLNRILEALYDADCHYVDYNVDFMLLGATFEEIEEVEDADLSEKYGNINCDLRFRKVDVDTFIEKSKAIVSKFKELANSSI